MATILKVILIIVDALIDSYLIADGVRRFINAGNDVDKIWGLVEASVPLFFITWDRFKNRD